MSSEILFQALSMDAEALGFSSLERDLMGSAE